MMVEAGSSSGTERRDPSEIIAESRKSLAHFNKLLDELDTTIKGLQSDSAQERESPRRWSR